MLRVAADFVKEGGEKEAAGARGVRGCARGGGGRAAAAIGKNSKNTKKGQTRQLGLRALLLDVLVDEGRGVGEVRVALRSFDYRIFKGLGNILRS